jgi:hypothetical protein
MMRESELESLPLIAISAVDIANPTDVFNYNIVTKGAMLPRDSQDMLLAGNYGIWYEGMSFRQAFSMRVCSMLSADKDGHYRPGNFVCDTRQTEAYQGVESGRRVGSNVNELITI